MIRDDEIDACLMALARQRGTGKSFCPSEAARALCGTWRPLMPRVRERAAKLPLCATQRGVPVDPVRAKSPIRLTLRDDL